MSSNGQAHKPVLVACRRSQHRARMSRQPCHRPDGSDPDVRDRVGHQASAVGADTGAAILPSWASASSAAARTPPTSSSKAARSCWTARLSARAPSARIAASLRVDRWSWSAVVAIPRTSSSPIRWRALVKSATRDRSTRRTRARSAAAAPAPSRPTRRRIATRATSGLGSSSAAVSSSGETAASAARRRCVVSTRRISRAWRRASSPPTDTPRATRARSVAFQLASAARIRSAVAASSSSAAGLARRKSRSCRPSIGTRWTCA